MGWVVTLMVAGAFAWPLIAAGNVPRPAPPPARRTLPEELAVVTIAFVVVILVLAVT